MGDSHETHLGEQSRVFQVAVGGAARRVVCRDQVLLHVVGERVSPDVPLLGRVEVHTTHAGPCGVRGAQEGRRLWNYLGEVCGPVAEVCCQRRKG